MLQRYSFVNALKGYAIFGVVSIHVGQEFDNLPKAIDKLADYGFRGVTLFFIVSAFTLSISLSGKPFDGKSYFIKRYLRIAPMYILAIILYGISGLMPTASPIDYLLNALLMHGISPSAQNTVVPGGWSVASEALFYILLPALLPVCDTLLKAVIGVGLAYVVAVVSHFGLRYMLDGFYPAEQLDDFIHFALPINLPAFMAGIALFHFTKTPVLAPLASRFAIPLLLASISTLIVIGCSSINALRNPLVAVMPLVGVACAFFYAKNNVLDNKISRHIGEVSFSIYLIHFIVIEAQKNYMPEIFNLAYGFYASLLLTVIASTVIATFTYRYIEVPFINWSRRSGPHQTQPV